MIWVLGALLIRVVAAIFLIAALPGCIATGRDLAAMKAELTQTFRSEMAMQVGGGGDSVVSWLAVAGLVLVAYPVQRGLRRRIWPEKANEN